MANQLGILVQLFLILLNTKYVFLASPHPKLLVVSYDGFRYDYFNKNITPFMVQMKEEWTDVEYMTSVFVTKTIPNHHTIATGFYAETHGVLETALLGPEGYLNLSQELFTYNKNILPIWTINALDGEDRYSGTMMWPGGEYKYRGMVVPSHVVPFNMAMPWKVRADKVISWFLDEKNPVNFAALYIEEPDFHAHGLGTQHPKVKDLLRKLDDFTKYLHTKLEEHNLHDVNVIHLSDHGMADVTMSKIVNITELVGKDEYEAVTTTSTMFIMPHEGKEHNVYNKFKAAANKTGAFEVWWKYEIPERYHYGSNSRMSSIFVVAKVGYAFEGLYDSFPFYQSAFNITITNASVFGVHGYDNEDRRIRPMFFAKGPAFLSHCKLEPFHNIDLLSLFCNILHISECPSTNGTLEVFKPCLKEYEDPSKDKSVYAALISMIIVICIVVLGTLYYLRRSREQRYWHAYKRPNYEGSA
ncbi:ectonucleotide pyrophosphatase/phosphodiesterase family member 5-like isoform X2 [Fopius arisanus]|uniref:Ectonucleotide pyrophosphatase/phosphodiesterase family member 5-like isoform X2 n=1 Tax=Fopius arisanus TaxID=64838 RepID=A0A9R1T5A6_9HYME|nr:PREDICTED: ectonucleotide pyrophosphatase/phosphodiesterase family member 5-like isoform X2 [Fopius arisanus]XP_011302962.1 PREDICTED: ectonucleotide pyrophosphatase/phosphodiesterase family member 5-like isoform X2 [Fopius arisanus]XP_011302963.1 PREDICTED: ectonucleotide pyrophosphatase/phosphodiesterase family member 5-like isoform X2 [Fopius arisanus]